MKRSILLFIISIFACAVYAQANIEITSNYPTGYIKSKDVKVSRHSLFQPQWYI